MSPQSLSPMKSYMNTAMAEVAEGMDNNKNILFCQVPSSQGLPSHLDTL